MKDKFPSSEYSSFEPIEQNGKWYLRDEHTRLAGYTIHPTKEDAISHRNVTANRLKNREDFEAQEEKEKQDAANKEAALLASYGDYFSGSSALAIGKERKTLEAIFSFNGKVMTRKEDLEIRAKRGDRLENVMGECVVMNSEGYFRAVNKTERKYFSFLLTI